MGKKVATGPGCYGGHCDVASSCTELADDVLQGLCLDLALPCFLMHVETCPEPQATVILKAAKQEFEIVSACL